MIIDNETELASGVAFDLQTIFPGKGNVIRMCAVLDTPGQLTITDGATSAAADTFMTVDCGDNVSFFDLPSSVQRYIKSTFTGRLFVVLEGGQTNQ